MTKYQIDAEQFPATEAFIVRTASGADTISEHPTYESAKVACDAYNARKTAHGKPAGGQVVEVVCTGRDAFGYLIREYRVIDAAPVPAKATGAWMEKGTC